MDSKASGSINCLPANVKVGEYRLIDVIGEGGFGIVYRALDLSLDRTVAIKEYMPATMASRKADHSVLIRSQHRGAFDAGLRSFINEARLLAKFSHPALVHVYRFFEANGTAYMVMRCYEGQTLRSFLESKPSGLDERWLGAVISPIFDVLEQLHAADCYHRDIAPDNVFLQSSGAPVLLDFGAARRIISDMTQALTMVLKPGFAPIEQYAEDGSMPQGAWTDIYQFGALLYQVVTGKPPATSVARMINDPIKPLTSAQYPGYSDRFLQGIHQALAVKPKDRPQTIAELRHLLGLRTFTASLYDGFESSSFGNFVVTDFSATEQTPDPSPPHLPDKQPPVEAPEAVAPVPAIEPPLPTISGTVAAPAQSGEGPAAELQPIDLLSLFDHLPTPLKAPASPEQIAATQSSPSALAPTQTEEPAESAGVQKSADLAEARPSEEEASASEPELEPTPPTFDGTAEASEAKPFSAAAPAPKKSAINWIMVAILVASCVAAYLWWDGSDERRQQRADTQYWRLAQATPTKVQLDSYLKSFPEGAHKDEAQQLLAALEAKEAAAAASSPIADAAATPIETEVETAPPSTPALDSPAEPSNTASNPEPDAASSVVATAQNNIPPAQPAAQQQAVEPTKPVVRAKGTVLLRIKPWGRVYVDRSGKGVTPPLMELSLPVGAHRISVTNPASTPMVWTVIVKEGEPTVLTHSFE